MTCLLTWIMVVPAVKREREARWRRAWVRWPWCLASGVVVGSTVQRGGLVVVFVSGERGVFAYGG